MTSKWELEQRLYRAESRLETLEQYVRLPRRAQEIYDAFINESFDNIWMAQWIADLEEAARQEGSKDGESSSRGESATKTVCASAL